nr:MAG TPA_asm: hypothetical protein [Caudoviricetes sp.]
MYGGIGRREDLINMTSDKHKSFLSLSGYGCSLMRGNLSYQ